MKYQPTWTFEFNACWEKTGRQIAVQNTHVILFQTTPATSNNEDI